MNTLQTKKLSIITLQSLLFVAQLFSASVAFASEITSYKPLTQAQRTFIWDEINTNNNLSKYPSIKIVEEQPEGKRYGTCHNFAISEELGLKGQIPKTLPIIGCQDWHENIKFTEKYCQKVSSPEKGDLIVYYDKRWLLPEWLSSAKPTHTGIVDDNGLVKSKWGISTQVLTHPTFDVPDCYGNHVEYYRINKPNNEILEDIQKTISLCNYEEVCAQKNRNLITYAEQGDNQKMWEELQYNMCTTVEATNAEGQSLVMIGAKTNNHILVKTAIQHGADLKRKSYLNQTALDLAKENNNTHIVQLLQQYEPCDQKTKKPYNNKPFLYRIAKRISKNPSIEESFWQL